MDGGREVALGSGKVEIIGGLGKIVSLEWGGVDRSPISVVWKESGQHCSVVIEGENSAARMAGFKFFWCHLPAV